MEGQLNTRRSYTLKLELSAEELELLKAMMQNPLVQGEPRNLRELREKLWSILTPHQAE